MINPNPPPNPNPNPDPNPNPNPNPNPDPTPKQAMINEKKAELERLSAQHDSLTRVEAEQKALIEKLTNNEA